jgi:plasmid stability protein
VQLRAVAKTIQVRNVPDAVHGKLTQRAAAAGLSLSDYVARELLAVANRDANIEALRALAMIPPMVSGLDTAADVVRAEREARDEQLADRVRRR